MALTTNTAPFPTPIVTPDPDPPYVWPEQFIEEAAPVLWFDDRVDIDALDPHVPPGPESAALLAASDHARLDGDGLLTVIDAWRRLGSWAKAGELSAITAFLERRTRQGGGAAAFESAVAELQLELTLTAWGVDRLLELACPLADKLPGTMEALRGGLIDEAKAHVIARAVDGVLDAGTARRVEDRVLPQAPEQTTGQLRSAVQRAVIAADPEAAERRRAHAEAGRRVEVRPTDAHTADLCGRDLPADRALAADNRITAMARALKTDGSPHALSFLRAQVFLDLLLGTDPTAVRSSAGSPARTGPADAPDAVDHAGLWAVAPADAPVAADRTAGHLRSPAITDRVTGTVHLIVPIETLLGDTDLPGEVPGHGAVPASVARSLAATATARRWCYTVIDQTGRAVGHGHLPAPADDAATHRRTMTDLAGTRLTVRGEGHHGAEDTDQADATDPPHVQGAYRPPDSLRHRIQIRDRTCRFPACRRPADACDLDHTIPYDDGGVTCDCNLAPLCRKHHRLKGSTGWALLHPAPGHLIWVTPTGRTYAVHPDPYV